MPASSGAGEGCRATLDDGSTLAADLLLVCTGVKPNIDFLAGSGIETDTGILVDDRMRTSAPNVWAAGDVAQARGFWGGKVVNGILPNAVEQGRIAGLDMADDAEVRPFPGAVPLNTYSFFGQQAISVGRGAAPATVWWSRRAATTMPASIAASCSRTAGSSASPPSTISSTPASCGS